MKKKEVTCHFYVNMVCSFYPDLTTFFSAVIAESTYKGVNCYHEHHEFIAYDRFIPIDHDAGVF